MGLLAEQRTSESLVAAARATVGLHRRPPTIVMESGSGAYLFDRAGNRYLDFFAGASVSSLGHGHSSLRAALHDQLDRLVHVGPMFTSGPEVLLLERLVSATSYNANLGILHQQHVMYVARIDGPKSARMYTPVGRRAPAHATALGKAILAFLTPEDADKIIRNSDLAACTPHTITDASALSHELRRIRDRGYAVDQEEFLAGIRCVGVPVRGPSGTVEAALSLSGSVFQLREEDTEQVVRLLQDAAYELSGRLGYLG